MDLADLLRDEADLAEAARNLPRDPLRPFPILMAKFKLTWRCNLRCKSCVLWQRAIADPDRSSLSSAQVARSLDVLVAQGLRKVHFSGGEVLLYPGFREVVQHARRHRLQVNFTTNGTLLDKAWIRFVIEMRVHAISLSIDGGCARTHDKMRGRKGAWKQTWKNLDLLQRQVARKGRGPAVAVNTLVTRQNIGELGALHDRLVAHGVTRWRLLPVDSTSGSLRPGAEQWRDLGERWGAWRPLLTRMPVHWDPQAITRSAARAEKGRYGGDFYDHRPCFAPWFSLFVDANGAVYPCCMGKHHLPLYGNLHEAPLEKLLDAPARREIRLAMASGSPFEICASCDDYLEENAALARHCGLGPEGRALADHAGEPI